jgi:hypothetical protein
LDSLLLPAFYGCLTEHLNPREKNMMNRILTIALVVCSASVLLAETLEELAKTPLGSDAKELYKRVQASAKSGDIDGNVGMQLAMMHSHASGSFRQLQKIEEELKKGKISAKVAAVYRSYILQEEMPTIQFNYNQQVKNLLKMKALQADIKAGKITQEQVRAKLMSPRWLLRERQGIGLYMNGKFHVAVARAANKITEAQEKQRMDQLRKSYVDNLVRFTLAPLQGRTRQKTKAGKITEAQAKKTLGQAKKEYMERYTQRVKQLDAFSAKHVSLGRLYIAFFFFAEMGISEKQITGVLDAVLATVEQARRQGDKFKLPSKVKEKLVKDLRLTPKQLKGIVEQTHDLVAKASKTT